MAKFGSVSEATRETKIGKSTIIKQCNHTNKPIRKSTYFRYDGDFTPSVNKIICGYSIEDDEPIGEFFNCADARNKLGIDVDFIRHDLERNKKPNYVTNGRTVYFLYKQ